MSATHEGKALEVNREQIGCFVGSLFCHAELDGKGYVSLRAFYDGKDGVRARRGVQLNGDGLERLAEQATRDAGKVTNEPEPVVFAPPVATFTNPNNAKESDVREGLALSVELDANPTRARERLEHLLGTASVVVASGGQWTNPDTGETEPKLHLHWRLNEPTTTLEKHAELKRARRLATAYVGADATNVPIVHPLRWPGTWHRKNPDAPRMARIVGGNPDAEIDLDEALELLEEVAPEQPKAESPGGHERQDAREDGELVRAIVAGDNLHQSLVSLSARLIGRKVPPDTVVALLQGHMLAWPEATQDERWQARFDSISGIVRSASAKFAKSDKSEGWPTPQPLAVQIPPDPYPLDSLPAKIRAAVREVVGFVKAPTPLVASSALSALSLSTQALVDVRRSSKLTGPTSLFLLAIAESGERKSTCDELFTAPLRDFERDAKADAEPEQRLYAAESAAWEAKHEATLGLIKQCVKSGNPTDEHDRALRELEDDKPTKPKVPRLVYGDITPEALGWSLANAWPSGGIISSEAGTVLGAHGMKRESLMRNLGQLNLLWDGTVVRSDRRTVDSWEVDGGRLTVGLQVQEPTLRAFFDEAKGLPRGIGFLARFLLSWPHSTQGTRYFTEPPEDCPALWAFNLRLAELLRTALPLDDNNRLSPVVVELSAEAKAAWVAFHDGIEGLLSDGRELADVRDVASKTADNAARLAVLFQVFERGLRGPVDVDMLEAASNVVAWHLNEARRFFGELAVPLAMLNAEKLDRWLIKQCRECGVEAIPRSEILTRGPNPIRNATALDHAVDALEDDGRARERKDGRSRLIAVNPALLRAPV